MIGGLVGSDCHNGFSGEGAAIGAGVGLLAGAIAGEARRNHYGEPQPYVCAPAAAVSLGYGYGPCGSSAYVYYSPNSYCAPGYYYRPTRPNYAVGGTLLGAASGALIGAGTNRPAKARRSAQRPDWCLAAWPSSRQETAKKNRFQVAQANPTPQPDAQSEQSPATQEPPKAQDSFNQIQSKPCPSSTYYWTTPPSQIGDAPRVPDAPRF